MEKSFSSCVFVAHSYYREEAAAAAAVVATIWENVGETPAIEPICRQRYSKTDRRHKSPTTSRVAGESKQLSCECCEAEFVALLKRQRNPWKFSTKIIVSLWQVSAHLNMLQHVVVSGRHLYFHHYYSRILSPSSVDIFSQLSRLFSIAQEWEVT